MAKVSLIIGRVLLGGVFCLTGLNGFLHFLPMPPPEGVAAAVFAGFAASRYMLPLIFGTQLVGGALVLSGRLTPLGLTLLAPLLVNIVGFHAFVEPKGMGLALVLTLLELALAWAYRSAFAPLFAGRPVPRSSVEAPSVAGSQPVASA